MNGHSSDGPISSRRKKVCWITPDYFLPVDVPVVPRLTAYYDVDWLIVHTRADSSHIRTENLLHGASCVPRFVDLPYRQRDPRIIRHYIRLASQIRAAKHDLVYTSFHGLPYFFPILAALVDPEKIIYAVHNATTPKGASNEFAMRLYHRYVFMVLRHFHVFSAHQLRAIASLAPRGRHYYAPLPLVEYGPSTTVAPAEPIRFLFFGHIRPYKRLDILIAAFKRLRPDAAPIELYIAGGCDDWAMYQGMLTDDPRIMARVEFVPVLEIPNLVGSCHYVVLPYQDIAQSAVLQLAFQYSKPVIVSDIEGFRESVVEGVTGRFFRSESVDHLSEVMADVIARHSSQYHRMQESVAQLISHNYSIDSIVTKYRSFIDEALESQST